MSRASAPLWGARFPIRDPTAWCADGTPYNGAMHGPRAKVLIVRLRQRTGESIVMKAAWLAALALGAFAASYFLFRFAPAAFKDSHPGDPPGMVWIPGGTFTRGSDNPKM